MCNTAVSVVWGEYSMQKSGQQANIAQGYSIENSIVASLVHLCND